MEEQKIYPEKTVKVTEDFEKRQKAKQIAMEIVEKVAKESIEKAFEKVGKEKSSKEKQDVNQNNGQYGNGQVYGFGTENNKFNVTISKPKGAKSPSYLEVQILFGGKRMISQIYMELNGMDLSVDFKSTEASAFIDSNATMNPMTKNFKDITKKSEFEKDLKNYFEGISKAMVSYLLNTKIGVDDKTQKNMNDSTIKENTSTSISLKDLMEGSFEDTKGKVNQFLNETKLKGEECDCKKDKKDKKDKDDKDLLLGDKTKEKTHKSIEERDKELKEITASGGNAGGAAYQTPFFLAGKEKEKLSKDAEVVADKNNVLKRQFATPKLHESIEKTPYGKALQKRASIKKVLNEGETWTTVEFESGALNVPKGMTQPYTMGLHDKAKINSPEELAIATHGTHAKKEESEDKTIKEEGLDLTKRKFVSDLENEKLGINKRYIISEKMTSKQETEKWKKLSEFEKDKSIKDAESVISENCMLGHGFEGSSYNEKNVSRAEGESELENSFEKHNDLETPMSIGGDDNFEMVEKKSPNADFAVAIYRISKQDLNENKAYVIDHLTKKLIANPKFDRKK